MGRRSSGSAQVVGAYEIDLRRKGHERRQFSINVQKLDNGDTGNVRLLIPVADVTDARTAGR